MKRCLRNIVRLPEIFLPIMAIIALLVILLQVSLSVLISCDEAAVRIGETHQISLHISIKELLERAKTELGPVDRVDQNDRKIDSAVLAAVRNHPELSEPRFVTETFTLEMSLMCNEDTCREILAAVEAGEPFDMPPFCVSRGSSTKFGFSVRGYTDFDFLLYTLGKSMIVEYTGEARTGGVILPEELYDIYGRPETLIVGWFTKEQTNPGAIKWSEEGFTLLTHLYSMITGYTKAPAPPMEEIPVLGYYTKESELGQDYIFCDATTWETLYKAADYYGFPNGTAEPAYRDVNVYDDIGITAMYVDVTDAARTSAVIEELMADCMPAKNYLITANDYNYKFAIAQLNGIRNLAFGSFVGAGLFSILAVTLIVVYALKRRRGEVYTLRCLGERTFRIKARMISEFLLVMVLGILVGTVLAQAFGGSICSAINETALANAAASTQRLSESLELMENNEALRAQLTEAIDAFRATDTYIRYHGSPMLLLAILAATVPFTVLIYGILTRTTKRSMMKRGAD